MTQGKNQQIRWEKHFNLQSLHDWPFSIEEFIDCSVNGKSSLRIAYRSKGKRWNLEKRQWILMKNGTDERA